MKTRTVLVLSALSACVFAAQGASLSRTYVLEDKDMYGMATTIDQGKGDYNVSAVVTKTVRHVYENGDADVVTSMGEMAIAVPGQATISQPGGPPVMQRMDKFNRPVGKSTSKTGSNFSALAWMLPDAPMSAGESKPFEQTDGDQKSKGTIKLVSDKVNEVEFSMSVDLTSSDKSKIHIDSTTIFDKPSAKPNHIEGKATGTAGDGSKLNIKFVVDRKKS